MYAVNVIFFIQNSRIEIEDFSVSKSLKTVQKSELVFSWEYNLFMYSKIILTSKSDEKNEKNTEMIDESDASKNLNNLNNLSNIKNKNF